MSRIYFHSPSDEAEVRGSERAHMGCVCSDLMIALLDVADMGDYQGEAEVLQKLFSPNHYLQNYFKDRYLDLTGKETIKTFLRVGESFLDKGGLLMDGSVVDTFDMALNTAFKIGSDPLKLMARLHGQCEIHCYVEGHNRHWLSNIIEQGLEIGLMRDDMGWESVVELLRQPECEPVVCSYSVCDSFPNVDAALQGGWSTTPDREDGDPNYDAYYDLPSDRQWEFALAGLRRHSAGLEMKPDNWNNFYFTNGLTAFDYNRYTDKVKQEFYAAQKENVAR